MHWILPNTVINNPLLKDSKMFHNLNQTQPAIENAVAIPDKTLNITDLAAEASINISNALRALLADVFALYMKTKNFHWHMSGPHFRDYHLLLDEQSSQIYDMTDPIAERARKIGGTTLRSIRQIASLQRIPDNDAEYVAPRDMLLELRDNNVQLTTIFREVHDICVQYKDVATTALIEVWIDETERRTWFLHEATVQ